MLYAYIGVSLIVGLLIGFVTLSVVWTARIVGRSIRDRSVSLLSAYDDLLEDRSRRLAELDTEIRQKEAEKARLEETPAMAAPSEASAAGAAPASLLNAAERISTTAYRDRGVGDTYRRIRTAFDLSPEEVLKGLPIQRKDRSGGPAARLLKELSFDTVYRLSTLPEEEQYQLLRQVLPEEYHPLLETYAASHPRFDGIAFYDTVQEAAAAEPGPVCVRVSPAYLSREYPPEVRVIADEAICEGIQVEADNVLYDYCIKTREIS